MGVMDAVREELVTDIERARLVADRMRPRYEKGTRGRPARDLLNADGREAPSKGPLAPPVGYREQPSIRERIREMVRSENLAAEARSAGLETFEEADDFEVGEDYDPNSPYEADFDPMGIAGVPRDVAVPELERRLEKAQRQLDDARLAERAKRTAAGAAERKPAEPAEPVDKPAEKPGKVSA